MANRRAIIKRRKAVRNIKKITRTMQLIATARFQVALNRAVASRPYTDKLAEMVADLAAVAEELTHPLMRRHDRAEPAAGGAGAVGGRGGVGGGAGEGERSSLVVISSNRGLCGGYNAHVLRAAIDHLDTHAARGVETAVTMVGKKGASAFRFRGRQMAERIGDVDDRPRYEQVEPLARRLSDRFLAGEMGSVWVAYMRFHSASRQTPEVFQLLPLAQVDQVGQVAQVGQVGQKGAAGYRPLYEIGPSAAELLDRLLPAVVRARLFQSFLDAAVSEQIARMAAMKAATEAAEEMIGNLTRQYNRARQSQITLELLDIVGGANALA
jgi:F-type H+-transporting ATPase subunit gamma